MSRKKRYAYAVQKKKKKKTLYTLKEVKGLPQEKPTTLQLARLYHHHLSCPQWRHPHSPNITQGFSNKFINHN